MRPGTVHIGGFRVVAADDEIGNESPCDGP